MLRLAQKRDIPALAALWQEAFGDGREYIDRFLDMNFHEGGAAVCERDGRVCAMAHLVPAALSLGGNAAPARYIYAVAVSRELRGQGLGGALMRFTVDWLRQNGLGGFLVPAGERLYEFYRRFGFVEAFGAHERTLYASGSVGCRVSSAGEDEVLALRERFFAGTPHEVWPEKQFGFIKSDIERSGGQFLKVCSQNAQGYVLCYKVDDRLVIREHTLDERTLSGALHALGAASAQVLEPAGEFQNCRVTGMALLRPDVPAWLGYDMQ